MARFDFITYMREIAVNLKELQHTDDDKHFHRVGSLAGMEELLANSNTISGYQLIVKTSQSGRMDDASLSDNLLDRRFFTFYLLKSVEHGI